MAQSLANTINALARLGHRPPDDFLDALLTSAHRQLPRFTPQGLANIANALATLEYQPSRWAAEGMMMMI
jgi:hypothetical protein